LSNCFVQEILLENYRNFNNLSCNFNSSKVLILGSNGSGKTSILESISLLSQGKGLRGSKYSEQVKIGLDTAKIQASTQAFKGNFELEIKLSSLSSRRSIYLNKKTISSGDLPNLYSIFWVIPQQNTLFIDSSQTRRKYFDRIVHQFHENHAANINKYEHYQRERLKILQNGINDRNWLDIIEDKMSELALEILENRHRVSQTINNTIDSIDTPFPKIKCYLKSLADEIYAETDKDNFKQKFKKQLEYYRKEDFESSKTNFGVMKTDFGAIYIKKNIDVAYCSTGEQQSSLITILLAKTNSYIQEFSRKPILLLDELFVHLDHDNKSFLSEFLSTSSSQTFVTATEKDQCTNYANNSQILEI
jgi:DNA replication and repair protein RecF